jgi:hypothetical protein
MEYSNLILFGVAEQWKVHKLFKDSAEKRSEVLLLAVRSIFCLFLWRFKRFSCRNILG